MTERTPPGAVPKPSEPRDRVSPDGGEPATTGLGSAPESAYQAAERRLGVPPVSERGRENLNPSELGFLELLWEDFVTHEYGVMEQGFWAVAANRFGNWRMGISNPLLRAPCTAAYRALEKGIEIFGGITLPYTTKLGRRVRVWHHGGIIIGARAIGNDVHIRQNTTIGVAQTFRDDDLPIIEDGADIGCGASILGPVVVGAGAKLGANAVVLSDIPPGATAMGNPAQVLFAPRAAASPSATSGAKAPAARSRPVAGRANGQSASKSGAAARVVANGATSRGGGAGSPGRSASPSNGVTARSSGGRSSATPESPTVGEAPRVELGRLALLGSANLDYLAMNFRETCAEHGLSLQLAVPEYGQALRELLEPESKLSQAKCTATLVAESADHLLGDLCADPMSLEGAERTAALESKLAPWLQMVGLARDRLEGPLMVLKLGQLRPSVLGQADVRSQRGLRALLAEANSMLEAALEGLDDTHLIEVDELIAEVGRTRADPGKYWHLGRVPFSNELNQVLARRTLGLMLSLMGRTTRLLVLDLDNTLWGGVLGEDGREGLALGGAYPGSAFQEFQRTLRSLSRRGIALAVASKNDEDLALDMMASHPEMILRPENVVAHRISWQEKAQSIDEMLSELSLGRASCMFIDDNPVERAKVKRNLPEVVVPEMPTDPAEFSTWLLSSPYLECESLTSSDLKRAESCGARSAVNASRRKFTNIDDFYRDLGMVVRFEPLGEDNQSRVLQLLVKTNQFNATTRRHDLSAVRQLQAEGGEVYAVGVRDRYSSYELMGVMILKPEGDALVVDSFLLSCRILGRTLEAAALGWACRRAEARGKTTLVGEIIETERNTPVRDVYARHGFDEVGAGRFVLPVSRAVKIPDYFTVEE